MSPDRKLFLPFMAALTLAGAACTDPEPPIAPIVCESGGPNYTSKVTITATAQGEIREEAIRLDRSFLRNGVGIVNSPDEQCGTSMTEFYSDPSGEIVVNGKIQVRVGGSERMVPWHATITTKLFDRLNPIAFNVKVAHGKVSFYRPGLGGWKTEIGEPKLPGDVLSDDTLQRSNIKIYQGRETQLRLRENVFEVPLFKDAREGNFAGLSIVLVDAGSITPEAMQDMPQEVQGHYNLFRKIVEEKHQMLNGELKALEDYKASGEKEFKEGQLSSESYEGTEKYYDQKKAELLKEIMDNRKPPLGIFMDGRKAAKFKPEWIKDQPELANTITVYLAIGEEFKPNPSQSLPKREQFPETDTDPFMSLFTGGYRIQTKYSTPGFAIHHEASHYEAGTEYGADTRALERMDKKLYPFIFVNGDGITYTNGLAPINTTLNT